MEDVDELRHYIWVLLFRWQQESDEYPWSKKSGGKIGVKDTSSGLDCEQWADSWNILKYTKEFCDVHQKTMSNKKVQK